MNLSVFLRALAGSALGLALLLGVPAVAAPPAQGATFTVDIAEDAIDADSTDGLCRTESGVCTLRAAVMQANALPGEDTIEIPQRFSASLALTGAGEDDSVTGDLDILDDLSIQGVSLIVSGIEAPPVFPNSPRMIGTFAGGRPILFTRCFMINWFDW